MVTKLEVGDLVRASNRLLPKIERLGLIVGKLVEPNTFRVLWSDGQTKIAYLEWLERVPPLD